MSHVCSHRADNVLGKQPGDYISIEFDSLHEHEAREEVIESLRAALCALMKDTVRRILVIGLGNRFITSDALGPQVARNILVTSHLYAQGHAHQLQGTRNVAVLAPGVMGQTGLESSSIIQSVSGVYHPDVIIAVDALATRTIRRINRVIQVNNTGIQPGSGVGNHRLALSEETLHVPVIATRVGGIPEQIQSEKTGILVDNDEQDIYNGLKRMLAHPECLNEWRENLRREGDRNAEILQSLMRVFAPKGA